MSDGLKFVFESPQATQSHKKRPRLVTSCDNCRQKKIKCLQASSDAKCEACSQAKVSCRFRDRERYFVERSRVMAGPNSRSPFGDLQSNTARTLERLPRSPSHEGFNPLDLTLDELTMPASTSNASLSHYRTQSCPSEPIRSPEKYARYTQSQSAPTSPSSPTFELLNGSSPLNSNFCAADSQFSNQPFQLIDQQIVPVPLFDLDQPQFPHSTLMPHYIQIFIQHFGTKCPYITYFDTLERFTSGILPPMLCNSLAALAVRFSEHPTLITQGLETIASIYRETAKMILPTVMYTPSMETLHALMLLAWSEYDHGLIVEFRRYCEMARRMALHLGLSADHALRLNMSEHAQNQLRITWSSVVQLNLLAARCA